MTTLPRSKAVSTSVISNTWRHWGRGQRIFWPRSEGSTW
jgi:hypothetical protein